MPEREVKIMIKEDPLDPHIHLHIHEIMPGRWLRPSIKNHSRILTRILPGVLLGIGIIGMLWSQWWR